LATIIKQNWGEINKLIPGYDPWHNSDGYVFDPDAANKAIYFIENFCRHSKGEKAGEPLILEPWQKAIIGQLIGWKDEKGLRRYREAMIFLPRKSGKSLMIAALANYFLFCDSEGGKEIVAAAADREQAKLLFDMSKAMIDSEPMLKERCSSYLRSITIPAKNDVYKVISSDASTKHGYNVSCAVIDELHCQKTPELVDVLMTSQGARREPITIHVTTAGNDKQSICYEKYDYACKVRDRIIDDPTFFPVIYEMPEEADWRDEQTWKIANPNLGVSVSMDFLRKEAAKALEIPRYQNTFMNLYLNKWTEQAVRWLPVHLWDACKSPIPVEQLKGKECYMGVDLSAISDISAVVLYFPHENYCLPYFFLPGESATKREKNDRVPYPTWIKKGYIKKTEGDVVDYDKIRAFINELGKEFRVIDVSIDRWNSTQLQNQLTDDGYNVIQFGQGFASMSAPSKELERLLIANEMKHDGNEVMKWMVSNVASKIDAAGNLKPDKANSNERIDGVVGLVMAIGQHLNNRNKTSVYAERGLELI
jgi:phage terminase large subunit-like protein